MATVKIVEKVMFQEKLPYSQKQFNLHCQDCQDLSGKIKSLTNCECRTCVLYFAGSRENEVDQVDKDYKNYKVHKVNWAEVNKMHLFWVFHIKI